ncbi:hypothetical protein CFE70_008711 [Pyrenophora teres f. teres 0-1]|uniref:Uncharacterized protein n=2 Tax=Pyrenophora teres f. teres TaxID=97479 RepID=E3RS43_PYRTT|nr:hypothetical protein PTT_11695 [Pyrenophora teres f. teres 0-1]KAE8824907.1 hypothetical protein PTNB85_09671 [Pyrenophora teres f. teres]CAA9965570.1 hypothetical protein PTMSG1_08929 [Pyrenophora teres f. maculata]KAE8831652.1 hypothetical protein HRS9139_05894 [Pyrenophora teres f. teres]KAE8858509.1 hypothetical protein PTNB29_07724 [Pyrenophora teres f. teres]
MQFTTMIAAAILAGSAIASPVLVGSAIADPILARQDQPFPSNSPHCTKGNNCCFSSYAACKRQDGGFLGLNAFITCADTPERKEKGTICSEIGVSTANCTADCCRVDSATGRNCPIDKSKGF